MSLPIGGLEGKRRRLARMEALGALFIILAGTPLHFLYSATGWPFAAWLGPINESTWEHFKLAIWPGIAWALWEWIQCPECRHALWTAKLVALISMPVAITAVFYGYTALLGRNLLALDIGTFVLAVCFGQWLSYRTWRRDLRWGISGWLILVIALAFVYFSYSPPQWFLFSDPRDVASPDVR